MPAHLVYRRLWPAMERTTTFACDYQERLATFEGRRQPWHSAMRVPEGGWAQPRATPRHAVSLIQTKLFRRR